MKALILAGGFATRLRPLSCSRPKLLFPIANQPILDLTLERLAANGVKEAVLAVNFMADALEKACGQSRYGIKLHYSRDAPSDSENGQSTQQALGTGGPVKQAEELLGREEPFFVLNGDILTNTRYVEIMQTHRRNKGIGTIALRKVEDPSRYGVVELTKENRVTRFVEKPDEEASTNLVNAGIYVFDPQIFEYIPKGKRCSIEREIFPKLAEERKLYGHEIKGLWMDVGKPDDYIKANSLWLEAKMENNYVSPKTEIQKSVQVKQPVAFEKDVTIDEKSVIGPNVSLGKKVCIGKGVHIKDTIVFSHTTVSDYARVQGTIIGESVTIGERVKIEKGCLIGDNVIIHNNLTLAQNVKICPSKEISESIPSSQCIM
ncbi:MAG: sugar phosphate nucleotidyltransferase [Candidatus Bathyarchaeia archaeon]